jgi:hypothetical protein
VVENHGHKQAKNSPEIITVDTVGQVVARLRAAEAVAPQPAKRFEVMAAKPTKPLQTLPPAVHGAGAMGPCKVCERCGRAEEGRKGLRVKLSKATLREHMRALVDESSLPLASCPLLRKYCYKPVGTYHIHSTAHVTDS